MRIHIIIYIYISIPLQYCLHCFTNKALSLDCLSEYDTRRHKSKKTKMLHQIRLNRDLHSFILRISDFFEQGLFLFFLSKW